MKPYGPYRMPNGRLVMVLRSKGLTSRMVSYSRWLVEESLGKRLSKDQIVHHLDGNKENNELSNLEVMTSTEHKRHHYYENLKARVMER